MYVPNNIKFRIVSSNAMSQFLSNKAFDLNELAYNEVIDFSADSREILLLNYRYWFDFVVDLERSFVAHNDMEVLTKDECNKLKSRVEHTMNIIDETVKDNPDLFNNETKTLIDKTTSVFIDFIVKSIDNCENKTIYLAFPMIVDSISDYLHDMLTQLHECENLLTGTDDPFLTTTSKCENFCDGDNESLCPMLHRAKCYRDDLGIKKFKIKFNNARSSECEDILSANGFEIFLEDV